MLVRRAEAHDIFDAGAVVPAAIEDGDLTTGRKVLHVALHEHLALFAVGRRGQGNHPEHARADLFGDRLDGATLAGRIATFEQDDDP